MMTSVLVSRTEIEYEAAHGKSPATITSISTAGHLDQPDGAIFACQGTAEARRT